MAGGPSVRQWWRLLAARPRRTAAVATITDSGTRREATASAQAAEEQEQEVQLSSADYDDGIKVVVTRSTDGFKVIAPDQK